MKHLNISFLSLALLGLVISGSAEFKDMDPGVPLNPDDIQNAETITFDEEDNDILSATLEMAGELNSKIPLEDGSEAHIFQGINKEHQYYQEWYNMYEKYMAALGYILRSLKLCRLGIVSPANTSSLSSQFC